MFARVREVWVALLLLHLCFKYCFVSIDPLVLRHRLEDVLVRDVHRAFQGQLDLEVLANELSQRLVLEDVQFGRLIVVENLQLDRVVLHAVLYALRINDRRFVFRCVDQVEEGK